MSDKKSGGKMGKKKGVKKPLRVGTLFSGIGAFEQALKKIKFPHIIEFACDNGEIDFIPLDDPKKRKEVIMLRKKKHKTPEESEHLLSYENEISAMQSKKQISTSEHYEIAYFKFEKLK